MNRKLTITSILLIGLCIGMVSGLLIKNNQIQNYRLAVDRSYHLLNLKEKIELPLNQLDTLIANKNYEELSQLDELVDNLNDVSTTLHDFGDIYTLVARDKKNVASMRKLSFALEQYRKVMDQMISQENIITDGSKELELILNLTKTLDNLKEIYVKNIDGSYSDNLKRWDKFILEIDTYMQSYSYHLVEPI